MRKILKILQKKKNLYTLIIVIFFILLLLIPLNKTAFSSIPYIFLRDVSNSVFSLYKHNMEHLLVSIVLSFEILIFTFALLRILLGSNAFPETISNAKTENESLKRLLSILIRITEYWFIAINDIKEILTTSKKKLKDIDIDYEYLLVSFITGALLSSLLVITYPVDRFLFWLIFFLSLISLIDYIIATSSIDELDSNSKKKLGIKYDDKNIYITYGIAKPKKIKIGENIIALGISVGSGICGIITTLGAVILNASIIFTLVPITFDMISLLTALIEFSGLISFIKIFKNIKIIEGGVLALIPTISWSIYLGGFIKVLFSDLNFPITSGALLALFSAIWIMVAILLGAFLGRFKLSKKSTIISIVISIIPLFLLLA